MTSPGGITEDHTAKILGREPSAYVAVIGPILVFLAAVHVPFLSAGAAAAITALLSMVVLVWTTRPLAPPLITGLVTAGVAVLTEYGLSLSEQVVGALTAVALALLAFVNRDQVRPQETAITNG